LHVWETGCAQPVEQVRPPTHAAKPTAASGVGVVATCPASNALICASHPTGYTGYTGYTR
jgi:hypothetical protein